MLGMAAPRPPTSSVASAQTTSLPAASLQKTPAAAPASIKPKKLTKSERAARRAAKKAERRQERRQSAAEKNRMLNAAQPKPEPAPRAETETAPKKTKAERTNEARTVKSAAATRAPVKTPRQQQNQRQLIGFLVILVGVGLFFWFLSRGR
jgi:cobalamin biosynthesis Mg chelatase CobN